jgi:hypothetical protein
LGVLPEIGVYCATLLATAWRKMVHGAMVDDATVHFTAILPTLFSFGLDKTPQRALPTSHSPFNPRQASYDDD